MSTLSFNIISHLQEKDQEKISYFVDLLLKKSEYEKLAKEISKRKNEIKNNEVLSHKEMWENVDV